MDVNQTLHGVWPFHGLVDYIYIFGGSCPVTEFCQVQNSFCVQVLRSPILAALLYVGTQAVGVSKTLPTYFVGVAPLSCNVQSLTIIVVLPFIVVNKTN